MACCIPICRRVNERVHNPDTVCGSDGHVVDWLATRIAAAILSFVPASLVSTSVAGAVSLQPQMSASRSGHSSDLLRSSGTQSSTIRASSTTVDSVSKVGPNAPTSYLTARTDWMWLGTGSTTRTHTPNWPGAGVSSPPRIHILNLGFWISNGHSPASSARPRVRYFNVPTRARLGVALVELPVLLSDLATAGFCCLGGLALSRRVRSARRGRLRKPQLPSHPEAGTVAQTRTDSHLDGQIAFGELSDHLRELLSKLDSDGKRAAVPAIRLVRSGPDGLEFVLSGKVDWSPEGWSLGTGGCSWLVRPNLGPVPPVAVDSRALAIHPQGLSLQPYEAPNDNVITEHVQEVSPPIRSWQTRARLSSHTSTASSAGDLEVKLLTALPSVEGLHDPLPSKRIRRATEVIAYLALHQPDPISSDRLRTRVLGSPDSDAAAKTLFNTIGAARRALGSDVTGQLYLPNASRYGHYKLSELVTVDVTRTARLVVAAKSADSVDESIALYRAAFDLVKGEPLAGVLSGYSWWQSEGHEARLATTVVDAACRAVQLAISEGLLDLASWFLDRARLVDPYSEPLSRAAMATAAAAGDRTRLRREWDECRRRVNELDPGGLPSHETESLFHRLSRGASTTSIEHQASFAAIEDAP